MRDGDICDGIACFQLKDSKKILIPLQMKHTNGERALTEDRVKAEWEKVSKGLSRTHKSMCHFLLFCANFDLKENSINNYKIVCIQPEEYFTRYFKRIFTDRARLPLPTPGLTAVQNHNPTAAPRVLMEEEVSTENTKKSKSSSLSL